MRLPIFGPLPGLVFGDARGGDLFPDVLRFRLEEVDPYHGYFSTFRVAKPTATPKIGAMSVK